MGGGHHRGDLAVKQLGPAALREIGIATGLGVLGGAIWYVNVQANHREWDRINREYQVKRVERRKAFESWLATQPYDDEA